MKCLKAERERTFFAEREILAPPRFVVAFILHLLQELNSDVSLAVAESTDKDKGKRRGNILKKRMLRKDKGKGEILKNN